MADYIAALKKDLVEQFRGKSNIKSLVEVIGLELQAVFDFYEQLRNERDVKTSIGKQLDGVGDIAVMTRKEAGQIVNGPDQQPEIIDDETYRKYLVYKILKNTCDCTYPDLIKAFRMFWDKPLYYSEDPEYPATIFLETDTLKPEDHAEELLRAPIIKAAGVGIKILATTQSPDAEGKLHITPILGRGMAITKLPEIEPAMPTTCLYVTPVIGRGMSITRLPPIEPNLGIAAMGICPMATSIGTIMETRLPVLPEFDTEIQAVATSYFLGAMHGSILETKLPELKGETI